MGVTGIDLLAYVDAYPAPDAKIRTSDFKVQGGGNAGNTLTALSRLGVHAEIFTKVGDDAYGKMIVDELAADGLDTRRVIRKAGISSPFTYVIVDTASQTRTCLHTPSEDMTEEEITPSLLDGVDFLHLDGRNTLAAIKLARLARKRNIPVMLDAEKDRPHLKELVPLCDYLATNTAFPKTFTGAKSTEEGMAALLHLGNAKLIFTTLGAEGSMVMGRSEDMVRGGKEGGKEGSLPLAMQESTYTCPVKGLTLMVTKCQAWPMEPKEIVDTTGAGDAFIAGLIYGLINSWSVPRMLVLGGYVAAQKLKGPGARAGLPRREMVPKEVGLVVDE
jgi:sugar/nucleoside kinase (ribokinase family)